MPERCAELLRSCVAQRAANANVVVVAADDVTAGHFRSARRGSTPETWTVTRTTRDGAADELHQHGPPHADTAGRANPQMSVSD